jgi:hypothetical protein
VATKDVVRGVAGVAALGFAGREIYKETRKPKLFGVKFDLQKLAREVSKLADQVERASEDVRMASSHTKRVAKKLA